MEERRKTLFKKFTIKTSENHKYKSWFPQKPTLRDKRKPRPYIEKRAYSDGLYRSPIYAMRRILNEKPAIKTDLNDLTGIYNDP